MAGLYCPIFTTVIRAFNGAALWLGAVYTFDRLRQKGMLYYEIQHYYDPFSKAHHPLWLTDHVTLA